MSFKLMVASPRVFNSTFNVPSTFNCKLSADTIMSTDQLYVESDIFWKFKNAWKVGDLVTIGSSTYSGYEGKIEVRTVVSVEAIAGQFFKIYVTPALINRYAEGDLVVLTGGRVGKGWYNYSSDDLIAHSIDSKFYNKEAVGYDRDISSQRLIKIGGAAGYSFIYWFNDKLIPYQIYRLIGYYRLDGWAGANPTIQIYNNMYSILSQILYERIEGYKIDALSSSSGPLDNNCPFIYIETSSSTSFESLDFDLFTLGHAVYTSTSALGCIVFPKDPLEMPLCSISNYNRKPYMSANKGIILDRAVGYTNKEFTLSFTTEVDSTFLRDLEILNFWMQQGNQISLEHDFDSGMSSSIADAIPPILVGYFAYSINYSFWNLSKPIIDFTFIGS